MVLLNSRQGHFSAAPSGSIFSHPTGAILLPKLRIYFAEFLKEGSPVPLGILYPSTSVGLRYGRASLTRGFSRQRGLNHLWPYGHRHHLLGRATDLPIAFNPSRLGTRTTITWLAYPSASPHRSNNPTRFRNINRMSIAYASRPRLRPD